ncbi:hypothetical protein OAO31_04300 [Gammaproteobacteria bacterium]|nr:hypothetical protein [Gammaproteobacteria bacterium]
MAKNQIKLSLIKEPKEMGNVLNLERDYMAIIHEILSSEEVRDRLNTIEKYINNNIDYILQNYAKKNYIDIAIERLLRYVIYNYFIEKKLLKNIYASPISSDLAFETEHCILNIDTKTISHDGNKTDLPNLQFEGNQSSFKNKEFGNCIPIPARLKTSDPLPVLSYFVGFLYRNGDKDNNFQFYSCDYAGQRYETISLTCLPNGKLSTLFENDLVHGLKDYDNFKDNEMKNLGIKVHSLVSKSQYKDKKKKNTKFPTDYFKDEDEFLECLKVYLPKDFNFEYQVIDYLEEPKKGMKFALITEKSDEIYLYRPVLIGAKGEPKTVLLTPTKRGGTPRIKKNVLRERYDSEDNYWSGYEQIKIR